jgi:hypothetical protein
MAGGGFAKPPRWSKEQLSKASAAAVEAFIRERIEEPTQQYEDLFRDLLPRIRELFSATDDLKKITGGVFAADKSLVEVARYVCGPPISADDLRTLVGDKLNRKLVPPETAKRVASTLTRARDRIRFPWIDEGRAALKAEREAAMRGTAGLLAVEKLRTKRRGESSRRQEQAVVQALQDAKFTLVKRPSRNIDTPDALKRGSFTREIQLAGVKSDVLVRMRDGRLLAIECKVSNSAVNSFKRLNHETGNKAAVWRGEFGRQVVTAAVLSGVFNPPNLVDAQDNRGIFILWETDLRPLKAFLAAAA